MRNPAVPENRPELFQSLEYTAARGHAFSTSVVFHIVLIFVLGIIPLLFTETMRVKYDVVLLAPPPPERQILEVTHYKQPQPKPVERPPEKLVAPPPKKPVVTEIQPPEPPKIAEAKLPDVIEREREKPLPIAAKNNLPINELEPAKPVKPEIKTNIFSEGSSAKPTTDLPAQKVQTGGFGDPNGVKGEGRPDKVANIASLGSFDLPTGPGAGNGTGGAKGVKGTVASSGFGNGVAPVGNGGNGGGGGGSGRRGAVQQGGFDVQQAQPAAPKKPESGPPQTSVEVTFKPKPEYTEEARAMKIEGEVLLRVLFTATGEIRVLDVVQGLGHGLDQNATKAAQQIRFKPALKDGQPVDSTATVHIVFQLAY